MWIKFDLDGMNFKFKIEGYYQNQDLDGKWTDVSFDFEFQNIIKYAQNDKELLLSCEVDDIRDYIKDLLDDKLEKIKYYEGCEPDFEFVFRPKYDVRNDSNLIYVAPGHEIIDIDMKLNVNLWNGGLTSNCFSMAFSRKDIEKLYIYLCLVTKKIKMDDPKVLELIKDGVIYD